MNNGVVSCRNCYNARQRDYVAEWKERLAEKNKLGQKILRMGHAAAETRLAQLGGAEQSAWNDVDAQRLKLIECQRKAEALKAERETFREVLERTVWPALTPEEMAVAALRGRAN